MRGRYKLKRVNLKKRLLMTILVLALATVLIKASVANAQPSKPKVRYFEVHARQWAYKPNVIEVNQGDIVIINLFSDDVSHGIYIEGYGVKADLILGEGMPSNVTVKFKADRPGVFTFRCTVTCGPFHPFMTGKLIVKPNTPLNASIGSAVIAAIVAMVIFYVWRW